MTTDRADLLRLLAELSDHDPEVRLGQLVANLATLALEAKAEAIWDAEDEQLAAAARSLLEHYRSRDASVAYRRAGQRKSSANPQ